MKFNKDEQETILIFDVKTGEWDCYTCVPSHIRFFASKRAEISKEIKVLTEYEGNPTSIRFNVPKGSINLKGFIKKKRAMSEVQLKNLRHS